MVPLFIILSLHHDLQQSFVKKHMATTGTCKKCLSRNGKIQKDNQFDYKLYSLSDIPIYCLHYAQCQNVIRFSTYIVQIVFKFKF